MPLWERIVALVGAAASLITVVDAYVLKGKLGPALAIPDQVSTGLAGLVLLVMSVLLWDGQRRARGMAVQFGACQSEKSGCEKEIDRLRADLGKAHRETEELRSKVRKEPDLPDRIVAILTRGEASIDELARELPAYQRDELVGAIAQLVKENKVGRGVLSSNYRLAR